MTGSTQRSLLLAPHTSRNSAEETRSSPGTSATATTPSSGPPVMTTSSVVTAPTTLMAAEATTTFPDTALFAHPAGPVKVAGPATTWLASRERGPPSYSLI